MKKFLITGVRGIGKTSISGDPEIKDRRIDYHNYGDVMLQLGKKLDILKNDNDLENLEEGKRVRLQDEVFEFLKKSYLGNALLIDGHIVVQTPKGFIPGLKPESIGKFELDGIIFLTATPEEIVNRRKMHVQKYSTLPNWDNPKHIELHQQLILSSVLYCSMEFEIPFNLIVNEEGNQSNTIETILGIIGNHIPNLQGNLW